MDVTSADQSLARPLSAFRFLDLPGEVRNLIYEAVYAEHSYQTGTRIPSQLTPLSPLIFSLKDSPLWHVNSTIKLEIMSYFGTKSHLTVNLPNDLRMNWLAEWLAIVGDEFCSRLRSLRIRSFDKPLDITLVPKNGTLGVSPSITAQGPARSFVQAALQQLVYDYKMTTFSTSNIQALVVCANGPTRKPASRPTSLIPDAALSPQSSPESDSTSSASLGSLHSAPQGSRWSRLSHMIRQRTTRRRSNN